MEMKGNRGLGNSSTCNGDIQATLGDKFMQCSADQVMVLEQFFVECQTPSHEMRLAMIRENSVLSNLDSPQIKAWFENRRSLEKKKMAATEIPRSVFENLKMIAARRQLLLLENEYLYNEVQHLHRGNEYIQNLLENVDEITNSEAAVNSDLYLSGDADNTRGYSSRLLLFSGTMTKFPPKTPIACDCVSIPRMKFFEGGKEIFLKTCLDWTYFPVNGIIVDASVMLSFVKAATLPDGPLDLFLRQHQEFVVSFSLKDIKLDQIFFKEGEKSSTAIVPAFLPLDIKLNQILEKESPTAAASSFLPQDIKLDKIAFMDREESLTAVSSAFLPQRFCVAVGRYCVLGAWHYVPNQQAASGEVKFMLRFKFIN